VRTPDVLLCAADLAGVPVPARLLDDVERARARRYRDPAAHRRFLARRTWVRRLVAEAVGADPAALVSAYCCLSCGSLPGAPARRGAGAVSAAGAPGAGDHGRPGYLLDGVRVPLGLSVSSAGDVAVAALWTPGPVAAGMDVTPVGADLETVAEQFFTPAERAHVAAARSLPERRRRAALVWSAKEALAKAAGTGLGADPRSLETGGAPPRRGRPWRPVLAWDRLDPAPGEGAAAFAARLADGFATAVAFSRGTPGGPC